MLRTNGASTAIPHLASRRRGSRSDSGWGRRDAAYIHDNVRGGTRAVPVAHPLGRMPGPRLQLLTSCGCNSLTARRLALTLKLPQVLSDTHGHVWRPIARHRPGVAASIGKRPGTRPGGVGGKADG